ncbi:inactive poly [ADP-ribose] polymerase RCD1-like [Rutidosis leptorrhynchoides]|uniref:inactive poly [ADP-ribose] polymerase RCD1-like n=1 Tax=Rutidosis leptorrhynchoides TaxID=125765 RepID=UPI003A9969A7
MSSKWVKASDVGNTFFIDSKRKRASQIGKTSNRAITARPIFSPLLNKSGKRKRDESCKSSNRTYLKNYSNFMRSGPAQRLLFSQNGQWNDYSQNVLDLVKEDFNAKKASIELKYNGRHLMLDMLHMTEVDLKTGAQKPIAWIDDKGSCFFPETHSSYESHQRNKPEFAELDSSMTTEIKLRVEIELNGLNTNNFEECMDESNVHESNVKRVKVDLDEGHKNILDYSINDNCNQLTAKADQHFENMQQSDEDASPTYFKSMDTEMVKNMFMKSFNLASKVDIIDVEKCSGSIMDARLELFQKQVEITQKLRGNANVKYAWFASLKGATCSTLVNGLGPDGPQLGRYGYGVHLTAVDSAHNSATISDVDEKGVRCMVLCRVILGNMEVILPGSKQFYPSDESFDSGVDNFQNPNRYVIWNMNMNTHIYPEFAVTFKTSPITEENVPGVVSSACKVPNSPWMPFSKLFEAISDKVAPDDMKLVHIFYESLKGKKTSREEFIKKLRVIVGDQILRSTISSLHARA